MNLEHAIIIGCSVLGAGIACAGASLAAGYGDSVVGGKAIESMTRQPELAGKIQINALIFIGLVESVPIISVVIAIVLVMANPFIK